MVREEVASGSLLRRLIHASMDSGIQRGAVGGSRRIISGFHLSFVSIQFTACERKSISDAELVASSWGRKKGTSAPNCFPISAYSGESVERMTRVTEGDFLAASIIQPISGLPKSGLIFL